MFADMNAVRASIYYYRQYTTGLMHSLLYFKIGRVKIHSLLSLVILFRIFM